MAGNEVFDLTGRLAHKADPALIGADAAHFAELAAAVDEQVATLARRLDIARRSPGRQGQEAMDRDLEIHRISGRLRLLRRFGLELCLGRIVSAADGQATYVGRFGIAGPGERRLLVDWRSPAAEPFFAATHADPMGLASRRRYRWNNGRVSDYWDEAFGDGQRAGAARSTGSGNELALDEDSTFIASLGAARTPRMRDVLATIAADQDAVIRAPGSGALVVAGGPGTGKTVVALHRAAYLLYADPKLGRGRGHILFVGPHAPYLAYVADVLPSLGEEGVRTTTLASLVAEGPSAGAEADERVAELKADRRMVAAIEPAVRFYEEPPAGTIIETPWGELDLSGDDWADAFDAVEVGTPHNEAREQIMDAVADLLVRRHGRAIPPAQLRRELLADRELTEELNQAWPILEATDLVSDLWSVPAYLRLCAPWLTRAEIQLLQRPTTSAWTVGDLPLLDAARRRLGDPAGFRRHRARRAAAERELQVMDQVVDHLVSSDDTDMLVMSMLRLPDLQTALANPSGLAQPEPDLYAGPFAHIVVDEAQELTDAQWQMLLARCPSRSFTIVGDRAQARHGFTSSWEDRLAGLGITDARVAALRINYRTPVEVMAEAEPVIRRAIPDADVPMSIRASGVPVRHGAADELDPILADWLATHPDGIACVIGAPEFPGRPRVASLTPELAKGLEFDLVVLVDPHRLGSGVSGAVDSYVSMTRATQELVILATATPPASG